MEFGRVFFARVASLDDPHPLGAQDLLIFSASFLHYDGEAANVVLECLYPQSGLLSGPRFGVLSVEVDGVETVIARGQIVGHPIALPGERVAVELMCRRPEHSEQIDTIYAPIDAEIPRELADQNTKRRSSPFVAATPYIDPVTLEASLNPIAGGETVARELVGENVAGQRSEILSMRFSVSQTPCSAVELVVDCSFTEQRIRDLDLLQGTSFFLDNRTLTPNALLASMKSPTFDGSGVDLLHARLDVTPQESYRVLTRAEAVDESSCIVTKAQIEEIRAFNIDRAEMNVLVYAEQPRNEVMTFRMRSLTQDLGGAEVVTENLSLVNIESRLFRSVPYLVPNDNGGSDIRFKRIVAEQSALAQTATPTTLAFRSGFQDILDALAARAAKILVERAHCVEITLRTTLRAAFGLTIKDRLTIRDSRFLGGEATGKITSIAYDIGSSEEAEIVISCPVAAPGEEAEFGFQTEYTRDIKPGVGPRIAPIVDALRRGDLFTYNEIVESANFTGLLDEQLPIIAPGNPDLPNAQEIQDPLDVIPQTGFEVVLQDLDPLSPDELGDFAFELEDAVFRVSRGIVLA